MTQEEMLAEFGLCARREFRDHMDLTRGTADDVEESVEQVAMAFRNMLIAAHRREQTLDGIAAKLLHCAH